ncbi:MAG: response regulator transcription factor [Alphaproteobacteria bacterium]
MAETQYRSVLIADDHPLFREAMAGLIARDPEFRVAAIANNFTEACAALQSTGAPIAVIDMHMPDMSWREGLARLKQISPSLIVVAVSGDMDAALVRAAMEAGIKGYVPKAFAAESIMAALRLVVTGVPYVPPDLLANAPAGEPAAATRVDRALTPRESEVLKMMVKGATHKEIARALDLAEITVKLHVKRIVEKLNAKNRSEAIAKAVRDGLASLD